MPSEKKPKKKDEHDYRLKIRSIMKVLKDEAKKERKESSSKKKAA